MDQKDIGILIGVGALAYWLYAKNRQQPLPDIEFDDSEFINLSDGSGLTDLNQPSTLSNFVDTPATFIPTEELHFIDEAISDYVDSSGEAMNSSDTQNANVRAFLWMLRCAEGTATIDDEGYRALFGWKPGNGKVFQSFATHPGIYNAQYNTTAAGAYQIVYKTWANLCNQYPQLFPLRDFTPSTQDMMAVTLIDQHKALDLVKNGQFDAAVNQINKAWTEWASLPSATVAQPRRSWDFVRTAYLSAGGTIV